MIKEQGLVVGQDNVYSGKPWLGKSVKIWQITEQNKSMEICFQENLLLQVKYDSIKVQNYLCKTGNHREQYSGYKCVCCALEGSMCWNQGKHRGCTKMLQNTHIDEASNTEVQGAGQEVRAEVGKR